MEQRPDPLVLDARVNGQLHELEVSADPLGDQLGGQPCLDSVAPPLAALAGVAVGEPNRPRDEGRRDESEPAPLDVLGQLLAGEPLDVSLVFVVPVCPEGCAVDRRQFARPFLGQGCRISEGCRDQHCLTHGAACGRPGRCRCRARTRRSGRPDRPGSLPR